MVSVALHYTVDGPDEAPVLVLGSSLGTTGAMWDPQVAQLAAQFRVVRYDHRGHGGSPVPAGPYTMDDLGGDVLALIDSLGVERVHLGGLSLGGMAAMWVASHAPERVDRMVLVCTSAKFGPPELWRSRAATVRAEGMAAVADGVLGRWLTADFATREPAARERLRAMLLATPSDGYAACCGAVETMDLEDDLPAVTAPTLVIAGLEDEATPPEHARNIVARIPGATLAVVADAAHLANIARPDLVGQLMVDHLRGTAP